MVRSGSEVGAGTGALSDADLLPVLPALRDLLPHGALRRGSVVAASGWNLLCLALAAGPVASGAWCAAAGIPEFGVAAAADAGLDPARLLLVPDLGPNWPQTVISLLDGCDLVVLRPPHRPPAQARRKLEAAVRRHGSVLLVAGDWDGAQVRLRIAAQGVGRDRARARQAARSPRSGDRGRTRRLVPAAGTLAVAARPGRHGHGRRAPHRFDPGQRAAAAGKHRMTGVRHDEQRPVPPKAGRDPA